MKTIKTTKSKIVTAIVIYTSTKVTENSKIRQHKKYSFNVNTDIVKVGDLIKSSSYDTCIQIVKLMPKKYIYFNGATGELSNIYNSTTQWDIRTLEIREDIDNTVYGKLIK